MARQQVTPKGRRANAAPKPKKRARAATVPVAKERPLGANVPLYLKDRGYPDRQAKQLIKAAELIAASRDSRIVRLEHVMVADGTITEKDYGSPVIEQLRRSIARKRLGKTGRTGTRAASAPAQPRPRKKRIRVTPKDED